MVVGCVAGADEVEIAALIDGFGTEDGAKGVTAFVDGVDAGPGFGADRPRRVVLCP